MSAGADDDGEKPHDPTQRKLDEARKKGEIARSADLIVAGSYGGLLLAGLTAGAASLGGMGAQMATFLGQADHLAPLVLEGPATAALGGFALTFVMFLAPWFLLPASLALGVVLVQRGFVLTPSKLAPKLSRISLIANAGRKFGRGGLFEFAKSFVKLLIYSIVLWLFLETRIEEMAATILTSPMITMMLLGRLCVAFLSVVLAVALVIGFVDLMWQKHEHLRKNRMSFKELKDEAKDAEGDPHMKQERRQRAYQIASSHMMADVPKADVVIVNPTHYAVALKWSRKRGEAPVCVAKGMDEVARRIRELAAEHGVPLHSDPSTARALFATTGIGEEITPDHYRAVAAAVRFAEAIRRKAGRRR